MAHKKAGGSTSLGRDSQAKRLGVKLFDGQPAQSGNIIVRQRGSKIRPGKGVKRGADDTLYAKTNGLIKFSRKKIKRFNGDLKWARFVSIVESQK